MNEIRTITHIDNVKLREDGKAVIILDQSRLPSETIYLELETPKEMYDAIFFLQVRRAPAIGIFAAYCMAALANHELQNFQKNAESPQTYDFLESIDTHGEYLKSSRPTAVNLAWAVDRVIKAANEAAEHAASDVVHGSGQIHEVLVSIVTAIKEEAVKIHEEDIAMCRAISEYGLSVINDGYGILTHCNAGPLATSRYGTALGPILLGKEKGMNFKVFADETRPLLQGARLTAYELHKAGVDVTLICDNMASMVMKNGWVQACFVGCDRVAANGDTANKIGTSGVAILAKHYGVPFYVLGPTSTIDLHCPTGDDIPIEMRPQEEIREKFYRQPMSLDEVKCYNPAFDVTDNSLITAIITENGICRAPFEQSLKRAAAMNNCVKKDSE